MQNFAPGIGQHLPRIAADKARAGAAHALRKIFKQRLRIRHAASVVLKHNARGGPGYERKTGCKLAGPQLQPKPANLDAGGAQRLKMRVRGQKFGHDIGSAVTAVLNGLTHLPGRIRQGGAVFLPFKPYAQRHGVDVKPGCAKFVLRFSQAHGHAEQQLLAPKAPAKGAPCQRHKTGQHACASIFCQQLEAVRRLRININARHGSGAAGGPGCRIYRGDRRRKHQLPVRRILRAGGRRLVGALPAAKSVLRRELTAYKRLAAQMPQGILHQYFKSFSIARHMVHQHQHLHAVGQCGRHQTHRQFYAQIKGRMNLLVKKTGGLALAGKSHAAQMHLVLAALEMGIVYITRHRAVKKLLGVGGPAQPLEKIRRSVAAQLKQKGHVVID